MTQSYSQMMTVGTLLACLAVFGQTGRAADEPATAGTVKVVLTAKGTTDRMTEKPAVTLAAGTAPAAATVEIDPAVKFQEIEGFGGAFTEASADALSKISPQHRAEVIQAFFDPVKGLGYTICRTHIGSCDFSLSNYSYSEVPGDKKLEHFTIEHDKKLLIPYIKDAMAVPGAKFKIFGSPWSPPAWMKTNNKMNNGGKLKPDCAAAYALYFAKYIKAYGEQGIKIWGVTVQNEPAATQSWDSCVYSAEEERDFLRDHLGPTLVAEGLGDVKIMIWDHNTDLLIKRVEPILKDAEAAKFVWGTAFHWYGGEHFDQLDYVHTHWPDKKLLFTEGCQEGGPAPGKWNVAERYGRNILGDLNHWAVGWVDWNMVLNEKGGPNHVGNYCDAPILANTKTDTLLYEGSYYYLGHFAKFIRPGAVRIGCTSGNTSLEATAFRNTDGKLAVVVMNRSEKAITFALKKREKSASLESPAHSIMTLVCGE